MKTSMLLLAALLMLGYATQASAQVSIMARVAGNLSNVVLSGDDVDDDADLDYRFGGAFGIGVEFAASPTFALQPELLFNQHGVKTIQEEYDEEFTLSERRNYIQIPVLAKLSTSGSKEAIFSLFAGPYGGLGFGDVKVKFDDGDETLEISDSWEDGGYKTLDFGVVGGLGAAFPVGRQRVGIDVRYHHGLADIRDADEEGFEELDHLATNRNIQIGLSYIFSVGGK